MKIFHNAVVYTGQLPLAEAFAVENGKFVFVGTNAEASALEGQRVDLGGRLCLRRIQ